MMFAKQKKGSFDGEGIVLFEEVSHAMHAEKLIKGAGYEVKLVAPPPELRMGCDLGLEINLVEQAGIARLLKERDAPYVKITPLKKGTLELLQIVRFTEYGRWMMVTAGNMKLTFDRNTSVIVNISGGGCPDVPYLHVELVDKPLTKAPRPRDLGYTLCATMLDRAFEECLNLWNGETKA